MIEIDDFEWDQIKSSANQLKHGYPFSVAARLFDGRVRLDSKINSTAYNEIRYVTFAEINDRVLVCIWTWRHTKRRVISLRSASKRECNAYAKATG